LQGIINKFRLGNLWWVCLEEYDRSNPESCAEALNDENLNVRLRAISELGKHGLGNYVKGRYRRKKGDESVVPYLIKALGDENTRVRKYAYLALKGMWRSGMKEKIDEALKDENTLKLWNDADRHWYGR